MDAGHYVLSEQVHACETGGVLIFLDLKRDQYFSLDRNASELLAPLLRGRRGVGLDEERQGTLRRTVEMLLGQQLITDRCEPGAHGAFVELGRATRSLHRARYNSLSSLPAGRWIEFFKASAIADYKLRRWPIGRTVASIRARRCAAGGITTDLQKTAEWMTTYRTLRPLYPKRYVCLLDSLAALELLARHQCFPYWVFAVKASPFGAHCWLQVEDVVLNDSLENVSAYTPIMIV